MLLVSLTGLLLILGDVLLLKLSHALDLVQIDNEAFVIAMELLDTLTTENGGVVTAVEMLDSFGVVLAQFFFERFFIAIFKIEARFAEQGIFLDYFIENVDVEGESLG